MTPTAFAWAQIDGSLFPPPEPKRGPRFGADDRCWLCGGPTSGVGWPRATAFSDLFTTATLARVPTSATVCQPCVAMASKTTWDAYVANHPAMSLKTGQTMSWRNYSHAIWTGHHECPNRARWRLLLLDPPAPPFLFVIAESAQKHLLFRASVAYDREAFPVQLEEDTLIVHRAAFRACLSAFERLYALGFSKDSIVSGRYHHGQMLNVGVQVWHAAESDFAPFRRLQPADVRLAAHVAQKEGACICD